jgi:hypothetical protein
MRGRQTTESFDLLVKVVTVMSKDDKHFICGVTIGF